MQLRKSYESTNPKVRALELRISARELDRRGFPGLAQVNWELAEWIDPTPREMPPREPRRIAAVTSDESVGADIIPMTKRAHRASNRPVRRVPIGTSIVGRGDSGRIIRQTDRRVA